MRVRIVVADGGEALFYDADSTRGPLRLAGRMADPAARMHDRDLVTDRPGRKFDRAQVGHRGGTSGHAAGGEESPRKHETQVFARRVIEELERASRSDGFQRVVVMAGPAFLGLLRGELSGALRSKVVAEVPKDLVHQGESAVLQHLPQETFFV
jgi:protein required for attachment to host cells